MMWCLVGVLGYYESFSSRAELVEAVRCLRFVHGFTAAEIASDYSVVVYPGGLVGGVPSAVYGLKACGRGRRHLKAFRRVR